MCRTKVRIRGKRGLRPSGVVGPGVVRLVAPRVFFLSGGVVTCPRNLRRVYDCDGCKSVCREFGLPLLAVFRRPFCKLADCSFTFRRDLRSVANGCTE